MLTESVLYSIGLALVILGIIIIVIAVIAAFTIGTKKDGKVKAAGVIMIGPIPIIFGTDKKSVKTIIALAIVLTIILLIIFSVNKWLMR